KLGAGAKMKDLELMGFPYLVYVGRTWNQEGSAEVRDRPAASKRMIAKDEVLDTIVAAVKAGRRGLLPD
ncbi:MAG: prolyl-tRNA synthetase, partial [Myxococcota bacterium]